MTCTAIEMTSRFEYEMDNFEQWLICTTSRQAASTISRFISGRASKPCTAPTDATDSLSRAALAQTHIGWYNMMEGKISKAWTAVQSEHLHSTHNNRIAENWIDQLILWLLDITHSLWEARNDIAHIKDPDGLRLEEGLDLKTKVTQEYARGPAFLLQRHQGLYHLSLWDILQRSAK